MHPETTTLVRSSWKRVESIAPAAAALFYERGGEQLAAKPGCAARLSGLTRRLIAASRRGMHRLGVGTAATFIAVLDQVL